MKAITGTFAALNRCFSPIIPSNRFHVVDVFAPSKYAGNQLAVFHDRAKISDENKQRLARKMNYSEVTFIESLEPSEAMMSAFSIQ
jgi:predicted PhzF superfamily epimerase YddE/YHI9